MRTKEELLAIRDLIVNHELRVDSESLIFWILGEDDEDIDLPVKRELEDWK